MTTINDMKNAEALWSGSRDTIAQDTSDLAVVSRIWNDLWNRGDLAVTSEIFSKDYQGHLPLVTVHGPDEFAGLVAQYRSSFPDVHLTVEDTFTSGNRICVRWISRGTHQGDLFGIPASFKKIEVGGISIFRMENGKVAEEWENFDALGMMQTIGGVPSAGA